MKKKEKKKELDWFNLELFFSNFKSNNHVLIRFFCLCLVIIGAISFIGERNWRKQ
jgi:hypothetical protein